MEKQIIYLTFGDSITFGHDGITHAHPMKRPYPMQVAELLGMENVNRAVSGATLGVNNTDLCCMSERILNYTDPADVISLMIGVNDYQTDVPLGKMGDRENTTYYGALTLVAEHLKKTQPDAFIFFMTPFKAKIKGVMHTENNAVGYPLSKIREAIYTVAEKYSIPVLDMYNLCDYENNEMMQKNSDGLHPSQQFLTDYAVPQIVNYLKENCPLFR